ncbi:hypothetical protein EKO24_019010 [Candidatus Methylobacter oryzae]|uniref:Uncharacterized protein n=2 Tax=Candidatus Methylobacter oryzae TaxID=2497749 RepID=A0ABY3C6V0_9GAMM|nr:hypothetical protein EKO24_019010 [Candidatus Methylobacter oryzae]
MFLLALLTGQPVLAQDRAVEISISGIGPPVDVPAYETVRQVIGHAVAKGVIDKFVVSGYGVEGGLSGCVEASPHAQAEDLDAFIRQLQTIHPNPQTTAYSVKPTQSCITEVVYCTQDAKLCPDGSYVGRVPPSCSFAPCPGTQ